METEQQAKEGAQQGRRDAIEQALHRYGVHDGFEPQRRALAVQCDVVGITVEDIDVLAEGIARQRKTSSDSMPAILASLLVDPKIALMRAADMKRGRKLREPRSVYPGVAHWKRPDDMPSPEGDEDAHQRWLRARRRRQAYAIGVTERKALAVVAQELSVTIDEARALIAEEKALRAAP